jgi:hypothetical protein
MKRRGRKRWGGEGERRERKKRGGELTKEG